jgi:hypothetical protein
MELARQQCLNYLLDVFGVHWPKSCCRQCCFAGSRTGWPAQLARYQAYPAEAAHHVVDEFVTVALNKDSGLFGPDNTLSGRLQRDNAREVLRLAGRQALRMMWAIYRVWRLFWAPAQAWRPVQQVRQGNPSAMRAALRQLADTLRLPLGTEAGHPRLWLAHRTPGAYPALEEFFVAAPFQMMVMASST